MTIDFRLRDKLLRGEQLNWMEAVVAILIVAVALVVGLTFGLVILGLAVVLMLGFGARLWWLKRKWRKEMASDDLQGEYHVVERHIEYRSGRDEH
ncbi:MAG: hypothetical protein KDH88_06485 [Chromatiales bacterium]|nr:hypothetical protein [Chromatiales bacterium]